MITLCSCSWEVDYIKCCDQFSLRIIKNRTFEFPDIIENQQIGNLWQGDHIISLSLSGDINYLSLNSSSPVKVIKVNNII